ncbi:MAG: hypothetical protein JSU79_11350 [Dehalococcoidales bacterium]|nr:MAG: hypothetical protein JSU79_11350 [Dehalococcoidales bacterium]
MESTEKIRDLIKLLDMNQDHLCYEWTSLIAKINNYLDDSTRMLSGQLLSVMYDSLMEEKVNEAVEIDISRSVELDAHEIDGSDINETAEFDTSDVLDIVDPIMKKSHFALV